MNIYILRHGLAGEANDLKFPDDSLRPLTAEGQARTRRIGKAMKALDLEFDLILASPYLRALQTAEIAASALGCRKRLETCAALIPMGNMRELVIEVTGRQPQPEELLLVGHEPYLSRLTSLLTSGQPDACSISLKKDGLCKLECDRLKPGRCATLEWLLTPKQLLAMI